MHPRGSKVVERWDSTHILIEKNSVTHACRGCGKRIILHYNGGELDGDSCCGFSYVLEAPRIDCVVYDERDGHA